MNKKKTKVLPSLTSTSLWRNVENKGTPQKLQTFFQKNSVALGKFAKSL